jgi:hypothetical protein
MLDIYLDLHQLIAQPLCYRPNSTETIAGVSRPASRPGLTWAKGVDVVIIR